MNYIDTNIKKDYMNKTVGIIICKKDNRLVAQYTSDESIFEITYQLVE